MLYITEIKQGGPAPSPGKEFLTMNEDKGAMQRATEFFTGMFVVVIVGLWLAAAVLGPLAIVKYCWGYLF